MLKENKNALLIVDVQNDFCPGGALAVPNGDKVIGPLNRMIRFAENNGQLIVVSRDWHPRETSHFVEFGGKWPVHCVAGTRGALFHKDLKLTRREFIFSKGTKKNEDAYSAFDGTYVSGSLLDFLRAFYIERLYIGGLATDCCVKASALDARKYGFEVYLLIDACRAVEINAGDGDKAVEEMWGQGIKTITTELFLLENR